jgi:hypothetical protein
MLIQSKPLRDLSPLKPTQQLPPQAHQPKQQPDHFRAAEQNDSPARPKWLLAAFAGLGILTAGAGAAQAQVMVTQQPQRVEDAMLQLEEASIKQGIGIEFMAPSPIGGGRTIESADAARMLSEGKRVLVAEITREDGPVRGTEAAQVRRETYLTGEADLQSYVRYFRGDAAHNETEAAAQKLKKYVYEQQELTLLARPNANPERPTLSGFEAARRLEGNKPVQVRTPANGTTRLEDKEKELHSLADVDNLVNPPEVVIPEGCSSFFDFQALPDGTIQLVEVPHCPGR